MEEYVGVKFKNILLNKQIDSSCNLMSRDLYNVYKLLLKIGFVDIYDGGASGNISAKLDNNKLLITKSGYNPTEEFDVSNFSVVNDVEEKNKIVYSIGNTNPSSEAILHWLIYKEIGYTKSIIHWHSELLENYVEKLRINSTNKFYEYGTIELAKSAVETMKASKTEIIYLKNHGFLSIGTNFKDNFRKVIELYKSMLDLLNPF